MSAATPAPGVLFVCVRNAGKSQMAAALMRLHAGDAVRVHSAGVDPGAAVNALSAQAVAEVGADMSDQTPVAVDPDLVRRVDRVVVLGAEAAGRMGDDDEVGPVDVWLTDEPADRGIEGLERMRLVRDDIDRRVRALLRDLTETRDNTVNSPATELPVVVIGAGPVGLATAAHLRERGLTPLVLEAGPAIAAAVRQWGHTRLFSPWRYNVDEAARRLLEPTGWQSPDPEALPTGHELVEGYLAPLADRLGSDVRTGARVLAVSRAGIDKTRSAGREQTPFLVRVEWADGTASDVVARAVIDASGTWGQPNPLGRSGLPAPGELEAAARGRITAPLPDVTGTDRERFAGRRVLVVGAGHSAANTLLELVDLARQEPGTRIRWAVRAPDLSGVYGGGDRDELAARGALGTRLREAVESGVIEARTSFAITSFTPTDSDLTVHADTPSGPAELTVDLLVPAAGFRPDLSILSELRLALDPAVEAPHQLGPLIDPEFHSCGSVEPHGERVLAHPEPGFYIVGMKSYGRAPTFLMATGYEQVRSIAAALAGDREAADDVRLELPETGVCSTDLGGSCDAPAPQLITLGTTGGSSCC